MTISNFTFFSESLCTVSSKFCVVSCIEASSFSNSSSSDWERKDKSSNITSEGTNKLWYSITDAGEHINLELCSSAKRFQKLLVWKETAARLPSYVVQILLWRTNIIILFVWNQQIWEWNLKNPLIFGQLIHLWSIVPFCQISQVLAHINWCK